MLAPRWLALGNPANYYLLLGAVLLAVSAAVPFWTGQRTARIEARAHTVVQALAQAMLDLRGPFVAADRGLLLARFHAYAARDGAFVADLEEHEPLPGTLLTLVGKHYVYHVAESPPEVPSPQADLEPGYEVAAWPLAPYGPAHVVYFHPDDGLRAYTRNLAAGYHGLGDQRVLPGRSHVRGTGLRLADRSYRSRDDERWLLY